MLLVLILSKSSPIHSFAYILSRIFFAFFNMINTPFKCYKIHNLSRGSFAYHNLAIFVQAKEKDL